MYTSLRRPTVATTMSSASHPAEILLDLVPGNVRAVLGHRQIEGGNILSVVEGILRTGSELNQKIDITALIVELP